jgi:outer membrane protein TolC
MIAAPVTGPVRERSPVRAIRADALVLAALAFVAPARAQFPLLDPAGTNVLVMTPAVVNQLAEQMRTNHPALRAADARSAAAKAELEAVRTWEDPMVKAGGLGARTEMRADEGDIIYGIEQKLPLFGKPRSARRLRQEELATETANADYQFQALRRDLAKALYRAALSEQVAASGEEDLAWLKTLTATMEQRYPLGEVTQAQVLRIQNERARRESQLLTDRQTLAQQRGGLNRFLSRDVLAAWPKLELPPLAGPVPYNERMVNFALNYEPRLKVLRQQARQAQAVVDVTRRQRLPEVSLDTEVRNYSGDGDFRQAMVTLNLNLPWLNARKYRQEIRRDEARQAAAELDAADFELGLREELHHLTLGLETARREAILYHDEVLPRARQALAAAHADWMANRGPLSEVLEGRRMLLEARLMAVRAVAEQYQMLAELVLCCGLGDLEALRMIGAVPADGPAPPNQP